MSSSPHFSDHRQVFRNRYPLLPHPDYRILVNYIIRPQEIDNLVSSPHKLLSQLKLSKILEYRIQINDIQRYLQGVRQRIEEVIAIKCPYKVLQQIFELLSQVFHQDAIQFLELQKTVMQNCRYLTKVEIEQLRGYLRLL